MASIRLASLAEYPGNRLASRRPLLNSSTAVAVWIGSLIRTPFSRWARSHSPLVVAGLVAAHPARLTAGAHRLPGGQVLRAAGHGATVSAMRAFSISSPRKSLLALLR
jgi:hypothetical protein